MTETQHIETTAQQRVIASGSLRPYQDVLLDYEGEDREEHLQWVATAAEGELLRWAANRLGEETE